MAFPGLAILKAAVDLAPLVAKGVGAVVKLTAKKDKKAEAEETATALVDTVNRHKKKANSLVYIGVVVAMALVNKYFPGVGELIAENLPDILSGLEASQPAK